MLHKILSRKIKECYFVNIGFYLDLNEEILEVLCLFVSSLSQWFRAEWFIDLRIKNMNENTGILRSYCFKLE